MDKKEKPNYKLAIASFIVSFISMLATIVATVILCRSSSTLEDFARDRRQGDNQNVAISEWKKELSCLRIGYGKAYIENEIGIPQIVEKLSYDDRLIERCIYINSYFSLICFYTDDSLLGYLIIGNNREFDFENYRCNFKLFNMTIKETETYCLENGLYPIMGVSANPGERLDNSRYYFECELQHAKGGTRCCIIGYGVCDLGYIEDIGQFDQAINTACEVGTIEYKDSAPIEIAPDEAIRNLPINAFMIFNDDGTVDGEKFIKEYVASAYGLGMGKDELANAGDYMNVIDDYYNNIK